MKWLQERKYTHTQSYTSTQSSKGNWEPKPERLPISFKSPAGNAKQYYRIPLSDTSNSNVEKEHTYTRENKKHGNQRKETKQDSPAN